MNPLRHADLYPVITETYCAGRSSLDVLGDVLASGVRIVQLREKGKTKKELFDLAVNYRRLTSRAGALLIINDFLDIALAVEADGVHLGQDDLPLNAARNIAPHLIIGVSTHNLEEAVTAQKQGASYINIGPIFPTGTKQGLSRFLGVEKIPEISRHITIPFTVMGGINMSNISDVLKAGARTVAMVTGVTQADNIRETVRLIRVMIQAYHPSESV